jgi:hypothetical protein
MIQREEVQSFLEVQAGSKKKPRCDVELIALSG